MRKRATRASIFLLVLSTSLAFSAGQSAPPAQEEKLKVLKLEGTPYDRGQAHGRALKLQIQELVRRWQVDIEKSYSVPAAVYIRMLLEASDFMPAIERWTPGLLDEVRGIADGAGIDFRTMFAFQLIDETWVMSPDLGLPKCTSIAAQKRGDHPAFVAQTLDLPVFYHGFQTVLRIQGSGGEPDALVFTIPGVIAANGLNERSVAVCVNAVTQLAYSVRGLPVAFVIRGILRQKTYEEAVRFLKEIRPAAPQNYVIGGREQAASFERSADRIAEFVPFDGAEFTFHTNHPLANDDFNPKFIAQIKKSGMSLETFKALCPRLRFLQESFKDNAATLDLAVLKRVFADRNSKINNERTYGCTIMVLGDRPELHISPGRPDEEPFKVLTFGSGKRSAPETSARFTPR